MFNFVLIFDDGRLLKVETLYLLSKTLVTQPEHHFSLGICIQAVIANDPNCDKYIDRK